MEGETHHDRPYSRPVRYALLDRMGLFEGFESER
jgi:hypothetical protein